MSDVVLNNKGEIQSITIVSPGSGWATMPHLDRDKLKVYVDPTYVMMEEALLKFIEHVSWNYQAIDQLTFHSMDTPIIAGVAVPKEIRREKRVRHFIKTNLADKADQLLAWYDSKKTMEDQVKYARIANDFDEQLRVRTLETLSPEQKQVLGLS